MPALATETAVRATAMLFSKHLREGIRRGRIKSSIRIWMRPRVKVGGRYRMDDGHVVVDSIAPIGMADVTCDLARESGFDSVEELIRTAKHGRGENVYLVRFHYLPPGGWDVVHRASRDGAVIPVPVRMPKPARRRRTRR